MKKAITVKEKAVVLTSFNQKLESLQLESNYCMRTDCYYIFDKSVPQGCQAYTGVFVKKEDLPRDPESDLLVNVPGINDWINEGRSLAISKFKHEQQEMEQLHLDASG